MSETLDLPFVGAIKMSGLYFVKMFEVPGHILLKRRVTFFLGVLGISSFS
jgi:hypothetical protein